MKDIAIPSKAHNPSNMGLMQGHSRMVSVILILAMVSLTILAVYLISDILSFKSCTAHNAAPKESFFAPGCQSVNSGDTWPSEIVHIFQSQSSRTVDNLNTTNTNATSDDATNATIINNTYNVSVDISNADINGEAVNPINLSANTSLRDGRIVTGNLSQQSDSLSSSNSSRTGKTVSPLQPWEGNSGSDRSSSAASGVASSSSSENSARKVYYSSSKDRDQLTMAVASPSKDLNDNQSEFNQSQTSKYPGIGTSGNSSVSENSSISDSSSISTNSDNSNNSSAIEPGIGNLTKRLPRLFIAGNNSTFFHSYSSYSSSPSQAAKNLTVSNSKATDGNVSSLGNISLEKAATKSPLENDSTIIGDSGSSIDDLDSSDSAGGSLSNGPFNSNADFENENAGNPSAPAKMSTDTVSSDESASAPQKLESGQKANQGGAGNRLARTPRKPTPPIRHQVYKKVVRSTSRTEIDSVEMGSKVSNADKESSTSQGSKRNSLAGRSKPARSLKKSKN